MLVVEIYSDKMVDISGFDMFFGGGSAAFKHNIYKKYTKMQDRQAQTRINHVTLLVSYPERNILLAL